jgi:hypothetical protein
MTRAAKLAKPRFGDPCNGCGLCCLRSQCGVSEFLFGERDQCPALVDDGGRFSCGLVSRTAEFIAGRPVDELSEAMTLAIGVVGYCDAVDSLVDNLRLEILGPELRAEFLEREGHRIPAMAETLEFLSVQVSVGADPR